MATYAVSSIGFRFSDNEDFSDPVVAFTDEVEASSPVEYWSTRVTVATGADTTIPTSNFTTIQGCIIKNHDSTNYVKATYQSADTASQTNRVSAGDSAKLTDVSVSSNILLRANTASVVAEVILWGT